MLLTFLRGPAGLALLAAFVGAIHWPALSGMLRLWQASPMYSYGYLIAPTAAYLAWTKRDRLRALTPSPAIAAGVLTLGLWAAMLLAGTLGGVQVFQQLALLPAITGIVLLFFGASYLRVLWPSIAYLLLMIPIWDGLTDSLHKPFQQLSADIGIFILQGLRIPAFQDGVHLYLPTVTLEVARECSGVNYLVAVIALGLPLGYLFLRSPWLRAILLFTAIVIAALANGLRVALIGVLAYLEIGSPLHGPFHVLHGLFVAAIGHVVLFAGLWFLGRREDRRPERAPVPATPDARAPASPRRAFGGVAIAWGMFLGVAALLVLHQPKPVPLVTQLDGLPQVFGDWTMDPVAPPPARDWWPDADARLHRRYRNAKQETADLLIVYFEQQRQSREVVSYRAQDLHRASQARTVDVGGTRAFTLNVSRAADSQEVVFWYELDGAVEASPAAVKLRTLWHALGRGHTNGALIMLTTDVAPGAPDASRSDELVGLARMVYAALDAYLPGRPAGTVRQAGGL